MRSSAQLGLILLYANLVAKVVPQSVHQNQAILRRDIDPRPLPIVSITALSARMRTCIKGLSAGEETDAGTEATTGTTIYRIPVAPVGHRLYFIDQNGEGVCAPNGAPNCEQTVVDETKQGLETVTKGSSACITVVRRPRLQMPDIAVVVQEGHAATDVTVFRYDGKTWAPYLCKHIEPIGNDPTPNIVADRPCAAGL